MHNNSDTLNGVEILRLDLITYQDFQSYLIGFLFFLIEKKKDAEIRLAC